MLLSCRSDSSARVRGDALSEKQVGSNCWQRRPRWAACPGHRHRVQMLRRWWLPEALWGFAAWLLMLTGLACTHKLLRPRPKGLREVGPRL